MTDKPDPDDKEPAEGSRQTVDEELTEDNNEQSTTVTSGEPESGQPGGS